MSLFGTAGIRGPTVSRVTPELALAVGRAVGTDARAMDDGQPTVVVARDGRETGPALAAALEAGLGSAGMAVRRAGVLPTPALAFASRGRRGVMVTASHNPPADNGLKLFHDGQEYGDDAEARIESRIEDEPEPTAWNEWGAVERTDPLTGYRAAVAAYAREHGSALDGFSIVVDCGNGMAGERPAGARSAGRERHGAERQRRRVVPRPRVETHPRDARRYSGVSRGRRRRPRVRPRRRRRPDCRAR